MDINSLLHGVDCACGKKHTCSIQHVYIENNVFDRLPAICQAYQSILLVADKNTFCAAGLQVQQALSGKQIRKVIFPGNALLVPNEAAVDAVMQQIADIQLIIGIGSGVIQDLCKYVSFSTKIPYLVVATAPSMDGYASSGAAMIMGGMKVTYPAGLPTAILADTDVLCNAPTEMIKAGYGDVIGKFSALNDWKLSQLVTGEYFCDYIYNLTFSQIERTVALAGKLLNRDPESINALMEALIVIGILMSFAGSSRPASGSEHHLSHFFEITGLINGQEYFPHGIDVAYSTVVTAEIREKLLANPFPHDACPPSAGVREDNIRRIYREIAESCIALQDKTGNYAKNRVPVYLEKETQIREILEQMPTADAIKKLLALAGLDISEFYGLYGQDKIQDAVFYAKDLKDRYTVLWMYYDFYARN